MITPPPIPSLYSTTNQADKINPLDDNLWNRSDASDNVRLLALKYRIEKVVTENQSQNVRTDVTVFDLQNNDYLYKYNQNDPHFAASINKLPVSLLLLENLRNHSANLDQQMTWLPSDVRAGDGVYDQPGAPTTAKLRDVVYDMLNHSGNTATRVVVNGVLGGPQAVNDRLAAKPQIPQTRLDPVDATRFFFGNTTSKESLWVMEQLMKKQDVYARFMKDALKTNIFVDFGVRSQLAGNDYIVLVNKVGILDDVDGNNRHDVGIIYNTKHHKAYGYSVLTTTPFSETDDSATVQANQSLMDIGRPLLRFSGDKQTQNQLKPFSAQNIVPEKKILF
ncbi:MAG: serine hydrolase [Candidatus Saccharimonadales bacterium]